MPALAVIEQFDVLEDRLPSFVPASEVCLMDEFVLQGMEEALRHGIVKIKGTEGLFFVQLPSPSDPHLRKPFSAWNQ